MDFFTYLVLRLFFFTPDKIPRSTTEATTTSFPRADKHHVSWWGTATHKTPLTGSMPTFQQKSFAVHYHFWRVTFAENQLEDISRRKAKVDRFQLYALKLASLEHRLSEQSKTTDYYGNTHSISPFTFQTLTSKFFKQASTCVTPQRGMTENILPCYTNHTQRAEMWIKLSTLSRPPWVQWQHELISLRFLPTGLLRFPQSQEQLSAGGPQEAVGCWVLGMPGLSSCLFAGRTNTSGTANTAVNFKASQDLARHSSNFLVHSTNDTD